MSNAHVEVLRFQTKTSCFAIFANDFQTYDKYEYFWFIIWPSSENQTAMLILVINFKEK